MKALFAIALIYLSALVPWRANACSSCQCGDPTLTLLGNEKPFSGRFRISGDYRYRYETVGTAGFDEEKFNESRFSLSTAYAPKEWLFLGISLPFVSKHLTEFGEPEMHTFNMGDLELKAKWFLSGKGSSHLYGVLTTTRFPTAPVEKDSVGTPVDVHLQPGLGSWAAGTGGWYSYFRYPFSVYASSVGVFATKGHDSMKPGNAWLNTVSAQYQIVRQLAFALSLDSIYSSKDKFSGIQDPNTGGFLLKAAPGLIWSPAMDLLVNASVQIPAVNGLYGEHEEGITVFSGVTYDFSL
jgi:hypothetical protein